MHEGEAVVAIVAVSCGSGLLYAAINRVSSIAKTWIQTALKRDMVNRGYSADEIIAVVQCERTNNGSVPMGNVPPAKPIRQPAPSY
jgi:hypothetical protein